MHVPGELTPEEAAMVSANLATHEQLAGRPFGEIVAELEMCEPDDIGGVAIHATPEGQMWGGIAYRSTLNDFGWVGLQQLLFLGGPSNFRIAISCQCLGICSLKACW